MLCQTVFLCALSVVLTAPVDEKKTEVVYLIDKLETGVEGVNTLPDKFLAKHESDGIALADPIPLDDSLPDGIYYKPANGEALDPNTKLKSSPKIR